MADISVSQERLWLLDQLSPGGSEYNVCVGYRLDGPLDVEALRAALDRVVARHDALRMNIASRQGRPYPVVRPPSPVELAVSDADGWQVVAALVRSRAVEPFDLARDPLLRAGLVRVDAEVHVLILVAHHIVVDDWSLEIILTELGEGYEAAMTGSPLRASDAASYLAFAEWQRVELVSARAEAHVDYWRRQLASAPTHTPLPLDRPRSATPDAYGDELPFTVPEPVTAALRRVAAEERATPFMVALTAYGCLLGDVRGDRDLVIGIPSSGRAVPGLANTVGFFVNVLPARLDLSGEPTLRQLLGRVRRVVLDALAHDMLPFNVLIRRLGVPLDLSCHSLFQTYLQLLHESSGARHWAGLRVSQWRGVSVPTVRFDLELHLVDTGGGADANGRLEGCFAYRRELFDAATIAGLRDRYLDVLARLAGAELTPGGAR